MSYLLLPRLQVRTANAQACSYVINAAPVMALNLFVHNLGRTTGCTPTGVAILHHDAQLLGEHGHGFFNFHPQQRRGATFINSQDYSSKNKHALSLQPTASCHLLLSLLIRCEGPVDVDEVEEFLATARIAGGQLVEHEAPMQLDSLDAVHERTRTGFWVIERQDLMRSDPDPLDALFSVIGRRSSESEKQDDQEQPALPLSWLTPTVLGYAATTSLARRAGVRMTDDGEVPLHAYCEPLLGLVQYVSVRDYGDRPIPFWRHHWPRQDVFIVQQQTMEMPS